MITLERLLTELKAESFNEIVAGGGCGSVKKPKSEKSQKMPKVKSQKNCGCTPPPPPSCNPGNHGCQ